MKFENKIINFGERLVGIKFEFNLVSKVYVIDPCELLKFKILQKLARWNLETWKPTWTFLYVAAEVSAPMAYGEMPGSWVQEESYVTVENGKNEFWVEQSVGFK